MAAAGERTGTLSAVATWQGNWLCSVQAGQFRLTVDEPPEAGGTGRGPMPTELLLASLSSCYAMALAWAARKRGIELPDLRVTATGRYAGQRFEALTLTVHSSAPAASITPLIEPARRVCYVSNTFASTPGIDVDVAGYSGGLTDDAFEEVAVTEGSMTGQPYGGTNQPLDDDDEPLPGEKPEEGQVGANPAQEPRAAQGPMSWDIQRTGSQSDDPDAKAPGMPDATGPTG